MKVLNGKEYLSGAEVRDLKLLRTLDTGCIDMTKTTLPYVYIYHHKYASAEDPSYLHALPFHHTVVDAVNKKPHELIWSWSTPDMCYAVQDIYGGFKSSITILECPVLIKYGATLGDVLADPVELRDLYKLHSDEEQKREVILRNTKHMVWLAFKGKKKALEILKTRPKEDVLLMVQQFIREEEEMKNIEFIEDKSGRNINAEHQRECEANIAKVRALFKDYLEDSCY